MALNAIGTQREQFALLLEKHRNIVFKVASTYAHLADERADLAQ